MVNFNYIFLPPSTNFFICHSHLSLDCSSISLVVFAFLFVYLGVCVCVCGGFCCVAFILYKILVFQHSDAFCKVCIIILTLVINTYHALDGVVYSLIKNIS